MLFEVQHGCIVNSVYGVRPREVRLLSITVIVPSNFEIQRLKICMYLSLEIC